MTSDTHCGRVCMCATRVHVLCVCCMKHSFSPKGVFGLGPGLHADSSGNKVFLGPTSALPHRETANSEGEQLPHARVAMLHHYLPSPLLGQH